MSTSQYADNTLRMGTCNRKRVARTQSSHTLLRCAACSVRCGPLPLTRTVLSTRALSAQCAGPIRSLFSQLQRSAAYAAREGSLSLTRPVLCTRALVKQRVALTQSFRPQHSAACRACEGQIRIRRAVPNCKSPCSAERWACAQPFGTLQRSAARASSSFSFPIMSSEDVPAPNALMLSQLHSGSKRARPQGHGLRQRR
eukprot:gene16313-biopygen11455